VAVRIVRHDFRRYFYKSRRGAWTFIVSKSAYCLESLASECRMVSITAQSLMLISVGTPTVIVRQHEYPWFGIIRCHYLDSLVSECGFFRFDVVDGANDLGWLQPTHAPTLLPYASLSHSQVRLYNIGSCMTQTLKPPQIDGNVFPAMAVSTFQKIPLSMALYPLIVPWRTSITCRVEGGFFPQRFIAQCFCIQWVTAGQTLQTVTPWLA
jgi:hypothetical protein